MKVHFVIAVVAAALAVGGCEKKAEPPSTQGAASAPVATSQAQTQAPVVAAKPGSSPLSAPADYANAVVGAQGLAVKTVDIASVTSAIQQFNASEGRYPKDLDELVAERYLVKIPATPAGTQLQYDAQQGVVRIVRK